VVVVLLLRALLRQSTKWATDSWLPRLVTVRELWLVTTQLLAVAVLVRIGHTIHQHPVTGVDAVVAERLTGDQDVWLGWIGAVFGPLGTFPVVFVVGALLVVWCHRHGDRHGAHAIAGTFFLTVVFGADLGVTLQALRGIPTSGFSALFEVGFPGGASLAVTAVYGTGAYLVGRHLRSRHWLPPAIAAVIAAGVGLASLNAGERASDVLAGYAAGALIVLFVVFALERLEARANSSASAA
jgi:membrane-associated phospholipid phosphatase